MLWAALGSSSESGGLEHRTSEHRSAHLALGGNLVTCQVGAVTDLAGLAEEQHCHSRPMWSTDKASPVERHSIAARLLHDERRGAWLST